ncbi:hypothetical protein [Sporosarcina sp. E16_8]|uniref:hypothetical protein n=1 Tax=Sporosarcina sp. E16_8 TaxID=2789295 RepID=UPI001A91F030|nr:hypothetical protein [Sporosarcina sp. E16_8]MBO0586748.1 hypothetical protein [Sporosarcina sp. E16_8]
MNERLNKPKGFGEILDLTFSLSKNKFRDLFFISLIFMGPIYLVQALISLASGVGFFRELGAGEAWYEKIISSFEGAESTGLGSDLGTALVGITSFFLFPVASAATLLVVNRIRKNETYTIGSVIKQAFSRYGPIIGSSILFSLIIFGLILIPVFILVFSLISSLATSATVGIVLGIILFLALAIGVAYLLTRWSFYLGSAVLGEGSPGFTRSWRLTRKRGWPLIGLYIIFSLIIGVISITIELTFGIFLGSSVLLSMIVSLASIFTTMIFSVGYAVMYLDLKVRHDADDLKEMIDDYNVVQ